MAYSTVEEVRSILRGFVDGVAADPDVTPSKLSDAQIEYEIKNADAQIDGALRRRYALPLPEPVPYIIQVLSCDIAAALADMTFRGSREYPTELSPFRLRYERAKDMLESIATGDYPIYNEGEGPGEVGGNIVINPYDHDVLRTDEVFASGGPFDGRADGSAEMAQIPYYPYLKYRW